MDKLEDDGDASLSNDRIAFEKLEGGGLYINVQDEDGIDHNVELTSENVAILKKWLNR